MEYTQGKKTVSARLRVGAAGFVGLLALFLTSSFFSWSISILLAWDTAALIYAAWTWITIWPMNSGLTASHAVKEDPSRATANTVVLGASVASLLAVGLVLAGAGNAQGDIKLLQIALGAVSVVLGWVIVHTIFALHYAELYYKKEPGGVDFPSTSRPSYKDFAYLAFTVGMTFQVSDTSFQTTEFRQSALRHSLISYLFGTVIVATTINLIAGLTK